MDVLHLPETQVHSSTASPLLAPEDLVGNGLLSLTLRLHNKLSRITKWQPLKSLHLQELDSSGVDSAVAIDFSELLNYCFALKESQLPISMSTTGIAKSQTINLSVASQSRSNNLNK